MKRLVDLEEVFCCCRDQIFVESTIPQAEIESRIRRNSEDLTDLVMKKLDFNFPLNVKILRISREKSNQQSAQSISMMPTNLTVVPSGTTCFFTAKTIVEISKIFVGYCLVMFVRF